MIPTSRNPLYSGHLKGNEELYVKEDSLVVIHEKKGSMFSLELKQIRCAYPVAHDKVRIFWRAPKGIKKTGMSEWSRFQYDFNLDLKKAFPDKKLRRQAEKTEAKRLANVILHASQKIYTINQPNMKGYLAMHTGEYVMSSYKGQCKFGEGDILITNLGIYFVEYNQGLCFDLPLDLLDSYDHKNKTVKIHYYEPQWKDGYDVSSKKNRKFEVRIKSDTAEKVYDSIKKAFSDGGAKEIRMLEKYTEQFASMTPDEHYAEYFSGKFGVFKEYDDYLSILAKRVWGVPSTVEVGKKDAEVIFACLCTGIPISVAGGLTEKDKAFREETARYHNRFEEYTKQYVPLKEDIMELITKNLDEDDTAKVRAQCNPHVVFDTVKELAEKEIMSDSFKPQSLVDWIEFQKETNEKLIAQKLIDYPYGFKFGWGSEIFCPWSVEDAKRIVANKDFHSIIEFITELVEKYPDISVFMNGTGYYKTFEGDQMEEIKVRVRRVYDEWCKTNPLSEWTDASDREWVLDTIKNLDEEQLEMKRTQFGEDKTEAELLRDAEMESENTKQRLERSIKPTGIEEHDMYVDAWYDKTKHRWFTTNPYHRIAKTKLAIMTPDACEQKFGHRANVFTEDAVELKHGYPAVYDEEDKWWVILSTISKDKITKEMVDEAYVNQIRYDVVEPKTTIANDGGIAPVTEKEWTLHSLNHEYYGNPLPLNERIRRLLFRNKASFCIAITEEDKQTQVPLITN